MSKFSSLIMPSTTPNEATIRQQLLFSDSVYQFAPSEDSIMQKNPVQGDLYSHYTPAPCAEDLNIFKRFIKDLALYRAEYCAGGLSNLSTNLSADVDESSVWQLITTLAHKTSSSPQAEKLMQARVLLKLAEIQQTEENEADSVLAEIDTKMSQVMSNLKNESLEKVTPQAQRHPQTKNSNTLQLLKAWFHLFSADETNHVYPIIATDNETLGTLYEYSSDLISPQHTKLCQVSLPKQCSPDKGDNFYGLREQLHKTKQLEIRNFQKSIMEQNERTAFHEKNADNMNKAIEEIFGPASDQCISLYTLPISLPTLSAKVTKTPQESMAQNYPINTIIAVTA